MFKDKEHIRDPVVIDHHVYRGYEQLVEAEWKYAYTPILYPYLCPVVLLDSFTLFLLRMTLNLTSAKATLIWRARSMRRRVNSWLISTKEVFHIDSILNNK